MASQTRRSLLEVLRRLAPGTEIREGIELALQQENGALIVIGWGSDVEGVCSGGFALREARFTPQRLAELAKMDGAIVVDDDAEFIMRANVHLIPDPSIPTRETGTRHRTAERLALQLGRPVVSVSEGRKLAILFTAEGKHELESPTSLFPRANQSVLTMERFRRRLDETIEALTTSEVEDTVVIRMVVAIIQRAELLRRLSAETEGLTVALGGEGNLIRLQSEDLIHGVTDLGNVVIADYARVRKGAAPRTMDDLSELSTEALYDPDEVAEVLRLGELDAAARPRGLRVLGGIPRLPESVKHSLVDHFGDLQKMLLSSVADFNEVEGIGKARAAQLRSYLDHLQFTYSGWGRAGAG